MSNIDEYKGFEQGPIRPPSESDSLLIRVTRNCPWNRCRFCPVYKNSLFSRRPADHVIKDIDKIADLIEKIKKRSGSGPVTRETVSEVGSSLTGGDVDALHAALHWIASGMESVFLQDANSLIIKTDDLLRILHHIRSRFPYVKRITSYARSQTIAKISDENMKKIAEAGLNRIHIGMESGSDNVLKMVEKGADKAKHIEAGQKVKNAGISLSEYIMPGLGGKKYSKEHALETADALNQIDPDYIRIRTLAVPGNTPLYEDMVSGKFEKISDIECARELRDLIANLNTNSFIKSDHILNLFEDIEGKLPEHKEYILEKIDSFFNLSDYDQMIYQIGRRVGLFRGVDDMKDFSRYKRAEEISKSVGADPENVDSVISEIMKRFI